MAHVRLFVTIDVPEGTDPEKVGEDVNMLLANEYGGEEKLYVDSFEDWISARLKLQTA